MANTNTSPEYLQVCHVNTQSLMAHWDEFNLYFREQISHIICLSETWLKPEVPDRMIDLVGYRLFRRDRIGKGGGGVAFYLLDCLVARILRQSDELYCRKPEYIIAEISDKFAPKLLLAVVYRPPNYGYLQEFENVVFDLQTSYNNMIIIGDFNIDMAVDCYETRRMQTFLTASNLYLVPFGTTHHLINSSTFLDLCMVDDGSKIVGFGQCDVSFLSAHDLIHVTYNFKIDRLQIRNIYCRDFTNFVSEVFLGEFCELEWDRVVIADSVDDKVDIFTSLLIGCYDRYAPVKSVSFKSRPAPWLSSEIKELMRRRNKVRRVWRKYRSNANYDLFKALRNEVQAAIRKAKQDYYLATFNVKGSSAAVWSELRHLGLVRATGNRGGCLAHSVEDLNAFFTSALSTHADVQSNGDVYDANVPGYDDDKFYWRYVTPQIIHKALFKTHSNSAGADGLSLDWLKELCRLSCLLLYTFLISPFYMESFQRYGKLRISRPYRR